MYYLYCISIVYIVRYYPAPKGEGLRSGSIARPAPHIVFYFNETAARKDAGFSQNSPLGSLHKDVTSPHCMGKVYATISL